MLIGKGESIGIISKLLDTRYLTNAVLGSPIRWREGQATMQGHAMKCFRKCSRCKTGHIYWARRSSKRQHTADDLRDSLPFPLLGVPYLVRFELIQSSSNRICTIWDGGSVS